MNREEDKRTEDTVQSSSPSSSDNDTLSLEMSDTSSEEELETEDNETDDEDDGITDDTNSEDEYDEDEQKKITIKFMKNLLINWMLDNIFQ